MIKFIKKLTSRLSGGAMAPTPELRNQPCYDKEGRFLGWFSRSVATVIFVYCKDEDGQWCVLGSERGQGAADYHGFWNCVCGYLDFNETARECALRELYEETGLFIQDEDSVKFVSYEDSPDANRQNVSFRFSVFLDNSVTTDFQFSKKNNERGEVGEIKWIRLSNVNDYMWAFGHGERLLEIFNAEKRQ